MADVQVLSRLLLKELHPIVSMNSEDMNLCLNIVMWPKWSASTHLKSKQKIYYRIPLPNYKKSRAEKQLSLWFAWNPKISTWTDSKRRSLAFQCLALAYLKEPVTRIFQHLYSLSTTCYFCQTFLVPQKLLLAVDPLHGLPISLGFQMSTHKRHHLTK